MGSRALFAAPRRPPAKSLHRSSSPADAGSIGSYARTVHNGSRCWESAPTARRFATGERTSVRSQTRHSVHASGSCRVRAARTEVIRSSISSASYAYFARLSDRQRRSRHPATRHYLLDLVARRTGFAVFAYWAFFTRFVAPAALFTRRRGRFCCTATSQCQSRATSTRA